jgi:lipid A disaccharide synthetase
MPFIGLPNIVLGAKHYPELLQEEVTPERMARELARVLDTRDSFPALASSLRRALEPVSPQPTCSERIAAMMDDWLGGVRHDRSEPCHQRGVPA